MKKVQKYFAGAALLMLATGCSHELLYNPEGEGTLNLHTSVSTDMKVVSRSLEDSLSALCIVWISNDKGAVRRYDSENPAPSAINLAAGSYVVQAWTGDSVPASWDKRRFQGTEHFTINPGETTPVDLTCKIANVGASVRYAEGIEEVLSDFSMTIGHKIDTLVYVGRENRRGYFMMPSVDKDLKFTLTGKQIDNTDFVYEGVIEEAKPATEYIINVGYTKPDTEVGGGVITIVIDEHEIEMNTTVDIVPPPHIAGYGFDIESPVMSEKGTMGRRSVYVVAASELMRVELQSDEFRKISQLGGFDSFEILSLGAENKAIVNDFGITWKHVYDEAKDESVLQINFEEDYLNALDNGDYAYHIKATDRTGKSATATLNLMISDAPVVTSAAADVAYFTATLNARAASADVTSRSFKYRRTSDSNWTEVEADRSNGLDYSVSISGLASNTEYEFAAVSDGFESPVKVRFTTRPEQQLPNSSFENWYQGGKPWYPNKEGDTKFWDTGNEGSTTLNASGNITMPSTDYAHTGQYSAYLESKYIVVKFAAGNIFAGSYITTVGTQGAVLGWGRPFTERPKKVRLWVKYVPEVVSSGRGSVSGYKVNGDTDEGIVYMALVDDSQTAYNNQLWPCIVNTPDKKYFDSNGSNVIAYGQRVFTETTQGTDGGLIQIEFDLDYKKDIYPSNVIFVASSSRYGDYFSGAVGSKMWIDDIELVYE